MQGHISWYVVQCNQSFQHQILLPKMLLASGQFLAHSQWSTIATVWDAISSVCKAQSPQICVPELDSSDSGLLPFSSATTPVTFQTQPTASHSFSAKLGLPVYIFSAWISPTSCAEILPLDTDTCSSSLSWFDKHLLSNLIPISSLGTRWSLSYNLLNWGAVHQFPMLNS